MFGRDNPCETLSDELFVHVLRLQPDELSFSGG